MVKLLGHVLAVFAMMASVINVQCAMTCSRQAAPQSHACCKHHKAPAHKSQSEPAPCAYPGAPIDEARMEKPAASLAWLAPATPVSRSRNLAPPDVLRL